MPERPDEVADVSQEVWNTLVALYLLNNTFAQFENQWRNIAEKAHEFLLDQGVDYYAINMDYTNKLIA